MIMREQNAIIVNVTILRHAVNENSCKKKINDWSTLPFGKQFGAEPL